jgi:HSP20 family protein
MAFGYEPFRGLDELTRQLVSGGATPRSVPMDAYRRGDDFIIHVDLPGVDRDSIDVTLEQNTLTISAERRFERQADDQVLVAERPQGKFSRQVTVGTTIDTENISASYEGGVLTMTLPVSPKAKPRRVEVSTVDEGQRTIEGRET